LVSILLTAVLIKFKVGLFPVSAEYAAQQAAAAKALQDTVLEAQSSVSIITASAVSDKSVMKRGKSRARLGKPSMLEGSPCSVSYRYFGPYDNIT
jgi:hypothetical protein